MTQTLDLTGLTPQQIQQISLMIDTFKTLNQQQNLPPLTGQTYDFSDLAGQLTWQGDAVAIQRMLRDEW
ncbi:hypothetical protein PN466_11065 [Roseofilum reptotaenium CS-1145]|uniref:Uncharacterized protein n=1 Tax=Roseofilum reptotaenium AO1-A TaxID=1925591 RepID=A0A1L9QPY1_9CYAN|nr:hypothetical protein [Roseofilum reptotaenium]MDB9517488.1 hypothetical protein [Roseofilum reptotaenium CS-1145]OJJ24730.1 hypothetical protein BI308_14950 [Roseofilum reptotaenium AO1-A]